MNNVVKLMVALLGLHALLKFTFFFVLPYDKRRRALDQAYGDQPTATQIADRVLFTLTVAISGLVLWRGIEGVSFLSGIWIGATLIQLYFHRFHVPLTDEESPSPPLSPIKMMSYAIQAAPWRSWREMILMGGLIIWALIKIL